MAIEFNGVTLSDDEGFAAPMAAPETSAPIEFNGVQLEDAPEPDVPLINADTNQLPTIESPLDLPGDLMARTLAHAKGGVDSFLGGLESLVPGTEKTVWRMPKQNESWLDYGLSKLAPLGIVGGPIETAVSPLTAGVSEGLRLSGELDKRFGMSERLGMDIPLAHRAESFAPAISTLIAAPFTPTWLGGMKRAAEASSAKSAARSATRAATGWQATEGALKGMGAGAPEELGGMLRTAASEQDRLSMLAREGRSGFGTKLTELQKTNPAAVEEITKAADPLRYMEKPAGYELFSKSGTYYKRGMSRTASEHLPVPEEIAGILEKASKVSGRAGGKGKLALTEERVLEAFNKWEKKVEDVLDPDEIEAVFDKLARTTLALRGRTPHIATPWYKPTLPAAEAIQPARREIFHSDRGLRVRAARQLKARARSDEGKNVEFQKVPTGPYFEHAFLPEESEKIREAKAVERFKAGKPTTVEYPIVSGEQFSNIARGGYVRHNTVDNWVKDPVASLEAGAENWGRAMGRTTAFGPQGEKWNAAIQKLGRQAGEQVAMDIDKAARRDLNVIPPKSRAMDVIQQVEAMTKMSLSWLPNMSQASFNVIVNGIKNTTKGLWDVAHARMTGGRGEKGLLPLTRELGLARQRSLDALKREVGSSAGRTSIERLSDIVLTPFTKVEVGNRNRAVGAGARSLQEYSTKLSKVKFDADMTLDERIAAVRAALPPRAWRDLKRGDLNTEAIIERIAKRGSGGLEKNEIRRATWNYVDRTQLLPRATAVPWVARMHPAARVLTQMKTFSMRAAGTLMEEVYKEARQGNFAPLARMAVTFPLVGEAVKDMGDLIRHPVTGQRELPDSTKKAVVRALENSLYVGGLGIFSDAISAAARGKESWTGFVAGPGVTDIGTEFKSLWDMGQHRFGGLAERQKYTEAQRKWIMGWAKRVPFAGSALAESMKSPQELAKTIRSR